MNNNSTFDLIRLSFEQINQSINQDTDLDYLAKLSSGTVHLNDIDTFCPTYIDRFGLEKIQLSVDEINLQGFQFLEKIIEPTSLPILISDLTSFRKMGDLNKPLMFFQNYRLSPKHEYQWVITIMQYNKVLNKFFCIDVDLSCIDNNATKLRRICEENIFKKSHHHQFNSLSKREIEVLKFIALGYNNQQISELLILSKDTIRTHRNHIWQKLDIHNLIDVIKYAHAFDIV